jgi:FtsZ-interacting cell division protein YlmF
MLKKLQNLLFEDEDDDYIDDEEEEEAEEVKKKEEKKPEPAKAAPQPAPSAQTAAPVSTPRQETVQHAAPVNAAAPKAEPQVNFPAEPQIKKEE